MRHVLLLTRAMIPSAVLCGQVPLSELAEQGKIEYRSATPAELKKEDLSWADTVVFLRSDSRWEASLAAMAKASGRDTIFVLDDDLLSVPPEIRSAEFYNRDSTRRAMRAVMGACRCFLSPSAELLKKYGPAFERAGLIEEPALPPVCEPTPPEGPVVIGFAGSVDRTGDVDRILEGALRGILAEYGDRVRLEFFGAKPALADAPGVRYIPYLEDYADYRRVMSSLRWDVGLGPMPDTPFHRCKHYNKYIEYAAYGIPGVFSDCVPYRRAVRSGENGLLVPNTQEDWTSAIRTLVDDETLRRRLGENARREAETIYSPAAAARLWEQALEQGDNSAENDAPLRRFDACRRRERFAETAEKLRHYGWRAPRKALEKLLRRRKGRPS